MITTDTLSKVRTYPPFDQLEDDASIFLQPKLSEVTKPEGEVIVSPQQGAARSIFIIIEGYALIRRVLPRSQAFKIKDISEDVALRSFPEHHRLLHPGFSRFV